MKTVQKRNNLFAAAALAAAMLTPMTALAEEPAVAGEGGVATYAVEGGYAEDLDTYLSPLRYKGGRVALSGNWRHLTALDWEMEMNASLSTAFTRSPAKASTMYDFGGSFDWGMNYVMRPSGVWRVSVGAAAGLNLGALYLPINGNNPATAKADVMLSLRARGEWSTRIGRLPVRVADCVTLPSAGAFFSQAFGETYYEIWLGNHCDLAHFGWWGNHFGIDNLLSAELTLAGRQMLVGYRFKVDSSWVNHLNTQRISHSVVIGMTFGRNSKNHRK